MMPILYVAGPFRGPTAWAIAENVRHAERYGLLVAEMGAMPLIPHANTALFHGQLDDDFWLHGTLELLRRSDAMVLIPRWDLSTGARGERQKMLEWGRGEVIFDLSDPSLGANPDFARLRAWIHAARAARAGAATAPAGALGGAGA